MKITLKKIYGAAIYALFFLIPLHTVWLISQPSIGSNDGLWQYGVFGIYATDIIVLIIIFFGAKQAYQSIKKRRIKRISYSIIKSAWAIAIIAIVSALWAHSPAVAFWGGVQLFTITTLYAVLTLTSWNRTKAKIAIITSAVIQSFIGAAQFAAQHAAQQILVGTSNHSPEILGTVVVETLNERFLRAYGFFPHPNLLGIYLGLAILLCANLSHYAKKGYQQYLLHAAIGICTFGLILTFSRGVWIATAIGIIASIGLYLWRTKSKHLEKKLLKLIATAVLVALVVGGILASPISTRLGITENARLEVMSTQERLTGIDQSRELLNGFWLQGVGMKNFTYHLWYLDKNTAQEKESFAYQPVHNMYLLILSELGVFGLIPFVLVLLYYIEHGVRVSRGRNAFQIGVVVLLLIAGMFDHYFWTLHAGILIWWVALAIMNEPPEKEIPLLSAPKK